MYSTDSRYPTLSLPSSRPRRQITSICQYPFCIRKNILQRSRPCFILIKSQSNTRIANLILYNSTTSTPTQGNAGSKRRGKREGDTYTVTLNSHHVPLQSRRVVVNSLEMQPLLNRVYGA